MGKDKGGFLGPKAIANRIKAKGLQKLRWYCQMCQKQCRDENGFKCHTSSESHQRQLLLFAEDPDQYIDSFSKEFFDDFVELLKRRFGTKRVHANIVYQEYIGNKEHVHMNSTQWETLTDFVKWLGREGHCIVDETEKGWFVAYVDRDWEAIKKQEDLLKKEKMSLDDEERLQRFVEKQIERAGQGGEQGAEATDLQRSSEEEKIVLKMAAPSTSKKASSMLNPDASALKDIESSTAKTQLKPSTSKAAVAGAKRKSALDEIMELEEQSKEKKNRKDHWLAEGIVVKVMTKKLGQEYYKKKGFVKEVVDSYGAVIKMLDSGDKIKVDQSHVETVIPALGKPVRVVNGAYRGHDADLIEVKETQFHCSIRIRMGPLKGRTVDKVGYEDISKIYQPS